jgi:hypothetical protein
LKADFFSRQSFLGVLPRDKLPKHVRYPSSIVINTHTSKQKGEHWLAVFYEKDGSSVFFDSFGHDPYFYGLENFLEKTPTTITYVSLGFKSATFITFYHFVANEFLMR